MEKLKLQNAKYNYLFEEQPIAQTEIEGFCEDTDVENGYTECNEFENSYY